MGTVLGTKPEGVQSASGPARRGRPASEAAAGAIPDDETGALIHRRWRGGYSIEVLAEQFHLSRAGIRRVINAVRARRLLDTKLEFVADPRFEDPAAAAEILGPIPEADRAAGSRRSRAPAGLPSYLASLYDVPLLSPAQERALFRKMNYLKYRAHQLRSTLDPGHCEATVLDEVERLQEEAVAIKNRLVGANLRLVVSIAKKYVGPVNNLFELISDGNMTLLRAVEKFDVGRGFKFSTYATWALAKNFSRSIPEERNRRARFVTGQAEMFEAAPDDRADDYRRESAHRRSQEAVGEMLGHLNDRERQIVISRFGIGGAEAQTLEQLGRELGITKERVRQIEARAREKLRQVAVERRVELPFD